LLFPVIPIFFAQSQLLNVVFLFQLLVSTFLPKPISTSGSSISHCDPFIPASLVIPLSIILISFLATLPIFRLAFSFREVILLASLPQLPIFIRILS
jgi:hypothetical protein